MLPADTRLRRLLTFQGLLYLATNIWALIATTNFLQYTNPASDIFEARSFAALCTVVALFLLAGAMRADLLKPASFLGFGSAIAIVLVELFHLPALGWQTLLWLDFVLEVIIAGFFIAYFFFKTKDDDLKKDEPEADAQKEDQPVAPVEPAPVEAALTEPSGDHSH